MPLCYSNPHTQVVVLVNNPWSPIITKYIGAPNRPVNNNIAVMISSKSNSISVFEMVWMTIHIDVIHDIPMLNAAAESLNVIFIYLL
jgi:hypothetical protein